MPGRASRTFKTSSGKEVEIVEYITGREGRAISIQASKEGADQEEMHDKMISACIIAVAGEKENVLDIVRDLPLKEYIQVLGECTKLFELDEDQKKSA